MRWILASSAVILGVSLSLPSLAATVTPLKGQVSINRGNGFQQVAGAVQANTGDSVMAGPSGSGEVVYPDGCRIPVNPGSVVTVAAQSPCSAFAQAPGEPPPDITPYLVGAGIIGGAVAGIVYLVNRKNDKPASP